jgi:hypothetical protein
VSTNPAAGIHLVRNSTQIAQIFAPVVKQLLTADG